MSQPKPEYITPSHPSVQYIEVVLGDTPVRIYYAPTPESEIDDIEALDELSNSA